MDQRFVKKNNIPIRLTENYLQFKRVTSHFQFHIKKKWTIKPLSYFSVANLHFDCINR